MITVGYSYTNQEYTQKTRSSHNGKVNLNNSKQIIPTSHVFIHDYFEHRMTNARMSEVWIFFLLNEFL